MEYHIVNLDIAVVELKPATPNVIVVVRIPVVLIYQAVVNVYSGFLRINSTALPSRYVVVEYAVAELYVISVIDSYYASVFIAHRLAV